MGLFDRMGELDFSVSFFTEWDNYIYLLLMVAILIAARYLYSIPYWFLQKGSFFKPDGFKLNYQLITEDNKGVAISLSSFTLALAMVFNGNVASAGDDKARNLANVFIWVSISFFMLFICRFFNLFAIVRSADAVEALTQKKNVAVALVESGAVIGSGFIIRAASSGDASGNFWNDFGSTGLYFVIGQLLFASWGFILPKFIMKIDLKQQLLRDNAAAGLSVGGNILAYGYLISIPIQLTDSIIAFFVWWAFGTICIIILRFITNKFMLWGQDMDKEIVEDENWGVALIEVASVLMITMICETFVGLDKENNVINCKQN